MADSQNEGVEKKSPLSFAQRTTTVSTGNARLTADCSSASTLSGAWSPGGGSIQPTLLVFGIVERTHRPSPTPYMSPISEPCSGSILSFLNASTPETLDAELAALCAADALDLPEQNASLRASV
jgi:hypothetical protein